MNGRYKYVLIVGCVIIAAMFVVLILPTPSAQPVKTVPSAALTPTASSSTPPSIAVADLIVYDGAKDIIDTEVPIYATSTVFSVLQSATASSGVAFVYQNYPGMGYLVKKIGDKINGTGGAYWQYWVNGVYAQKGASSVLVHNGDVIDWKFSSSQQ